MVGRKAHRRGDSDPKRLENAIPHAIRDGDSDALWVHIKHAEDNGLLTDALIARAMRTACEKDDVDVMRFLLQRATPGLVNDSHSKAKETLLMKAKSKMMTELLLDKGADVNAVDSTGRTALMHAAHEDLAEALIAGGADLETRHGQIRTALMHILMRQKPSTSDTRADIALLLIRKDADIKTVDSQGRTVLMTAVWRNHVSVVRKLLALGLDVNARDSRGRNVLHHLCEDAERAERMAQSVDESDKSMVELILNCGVHVNIQDDLQEKTPLHRAIEKNNMDLVRALLKTKQVEVDITDSRSKSPLHIAAMGGNNEILKALLQKGANVENVSDGGWTPLHSAAAGRGNGRTACVKTLLSRGSSATARLRTGKSPLHLACEAGDADVVQLLLDQPNVDIMARDNEGNTPLISAAKLGHTHIVKHLTTLSYANARSEAAIKASKGFLATILDFSPERRNGNRRENKRMYDLLYDKYTLSPSTPDDVSSSGTASSPRFRWIHCPSNNIAWCQELLLKRFAEQDGADAEGFKAMERSFNYQHGGPRLHAHYMRPMCEIVPRTHREKDTESLETSNLAKSQVVEDGVADTLPLPNGRPRSTSSAARSRKKTAHQLHHQESSDATLTVDEPGQMSRDNLSASIVSAAPAERQATNNMYLFAPYLHYETNTARREMQHTIDIARSRKVDATQPDNSPRPVSVIGMKQKKDRAEADKSLIFAHVDPVSCSMHVRRTLDQYYYRTIDTSKYRDHDQVVHRYQNRNPSLADKTEDIRMLMVDQLWIWIVGKDLVITSFPERWNRPREDPHNVLETIVSDINSPGRAPVSSVHELVLVIASRCFGAFDRHNVVERQMRFLDMFESSIGDAMDRETELFRAFKDASKEASRWLKVLTSPGKADYMYELRAPKLDEDQAGDQEGRRKTPGPKPTLVRTLLDIGDETRLMREIKDIRDELNMLRMIFEEQQKLLPSLHKTLLEMIRRDGGSQKHMRNIERIYADAMPDILHPLQDIERMDKQAERIYHSVRDLLDLKQNYAISMQAADTARQGRTLMVFTVVTVIFLPLSFLTAFFALDIRDFPHAPNGNQDLPLGFVCKYIFGIGFVVALLSVLLALAWERLGLYVRGWRRALWRFLHKKQHEQFGGGRETSNAAVQRASTWQSGRTARSSIELEQAPRRRTVFPDVERGVG